MIVGKQLSAKRIRDAGWPIATKATSSIRRQLFLAALMLPLAAGSTDSQQHAEAVPARAYAATEGERQSDSGDLEKDPVVHPDRAFKVAPGVTVIPDSRIAFVPNIGLIEGSEGLLVVDTGLGEENGARVLSLAREIAGDRRLYLTTTHFHPEHSFGAAAFQGSATLIMNAAQAQELREKGQPYVELFKTFGSQLARRLEGTRLPEPERVYSGEMTLDLGGREVILREIPAHTRGDQLIYVPDLSLIFTGDIAETHFFPIMPDSDASAGRWIKVLRLLETLDPKIVVPGHGAVGNAELLVALRLHIEFMRDRVTAMAAAGLDQQAITDLLTPAITAIYPAWDNQLFLPFEIAILYAEVTGQPPSMPDF